MKKYVKPEIEIKNFQSSEDFAVLTGADVFGNGAEEIPVSAFTYNAAASTVE